MKLLRLLPLVVGGAVAGMLAGTSPAHALTWTLQNVTFTDGATASGSFDYVAASNLYSNVNVTLSNTTLFTGPRTFTSADVVTSAANLLDVFKPSPNSYFRLTFQNSLTDLGGLVNIVASPVLAGVGDGQTYYGQNAFSGSIGGQGGSVVSAAPVPFDIPGGATIPTVGSLLALGAMRKVKKSIGIASKTSVASPATVS